MKDVIIYQEGAENWHYRPGISHAQRRPADTRKIVAYSGGVLFVLDHEQGIEFPVSR